MQNRKRNSTQRLALGGVLAALAVALMSLGTLLPMMTYVCPFLCGAIMELVLWFCGKSLARAWYAAVCILSLLMCPDREAAVVFLFFGWYPLVKPALDRKKLPLLWKTILYNISLLAAYYVLLHIVGVEDYEGGWLLLALFVLWNVTLYFFDKLLTIMGRLLRKFGGNADE